MTHAEYVRLISSIVWSLTGLAVGYGLGLFHASIQRKRDTMTSADPAPAAPSSSRIRWWQDHGSLARTITGVVLLLLVLATMLELYHVTSCQAAYNTVVARSIAARAEQTNAQLDRQVEQLDAQLVLLAEYPPGSADVQQVEAVRRAAAYREAVIRNREALIALRNTRVATPVPDADSCGTSDRRAAA